MGWKPGALGEKSLEARVSLPEEMEIQEAVLSEKGIWNFQLKPTDFVFPNEGRALNLRLREGRNIWK